MNDTSTRRRPGASRSVVTMRDIAEVAGVSVQTVSCVMNNTGSISDPIRAKVRKIADRFGYRPNLSAKAMRTGRTQTIGLVIADIRVPFFPELAYCVQRTALKRGYSVLIVDTDGSPEQTAERILSLKAMAVDGVITTESIPAVFDLGLPTVMIGAPVRGLDTVTSNDAAGGAMVADHLLRLGHRRIGLVSSPRAGCIPIRRETLLNGLKGRAKVVWEVVTPASEIITNDIRRMFNSIDVTAVVCSHDLIAIGVLRALWEMGVSVPADVSVIGYDDVQWSAVVSPGLTTVRQPFAELAEQAVDVLLDRMERPERRARRVVVDVTLVERETVADLTVGKDRKPMMLRREPPQAVRA
jgi:LacI family transcriptional regulator